MSLKGYCYCKVMWNNRPEPVLHVIDNLLSQKECTDLIKQFNDSKRIEYVDTGVATYHREQVDDPDFAEALWQRINVVPSTINGLQVVGLNNHFRFSKYEPGMSFGIHKDGINQNSLGHRSVMTLNIFLNDDFGGGETDFLYDDRVTLRQSVAPQPGRAALFDAQQYHRGNVVRDGQKYLLRTDVMVSF